MITLVFTKLSLGPTLMHTTAQVIYFCPAWFFSFNFYKKTVVNLMNHKFCYAIRWQLRNHPFRTFPNLWYPPPPCLHTINKKVCLFLRLGLDVIHGATLSSLCLTIVTVFADFPGVTSSLCAIEKHFRSLDRTKKLKSLQGAGAIRPCGWPVCRCTAGPPWAAWTWCGWSGWWGAIVETGLVWCWIIWWLAPWLAPEFVIEATVSVSCGCCCWGGCWGCRGCWVCWPPLPSCGGRLCRISGGAISYL